MYTLERYRGARSRHTCPACHRPNEFTYYVDESGRALAPMVGRCNHESSCGYHYKPKDFFRDHPTLEVPESWREEKQVKDKRLWFIDRAQVTRFRSDQSNLITFLRRTFPIDKVEEACRKYMIGALATGETVFWQIDKDGNPRSAKLMQYELDGHRSKRDGKECGWLHSRLKKDDLLPAEWELTQCFFGEHLLRLEPDKTIGIVESEKTALICSIAMPSYLWLATGGKNALSSKVSALSGRKVKVVVFPDADAYEEWGVVVERMKGLYDVHLAPNNYTEDQRKYDLADLILSNVRRD